MKITHTVEPLDSLESWSRLADLLGGEAIDVVRNTIRHLRVLNVKSYVLEDPYIDQDYSSDYSQFYARTFRTYDRLCKRIHFFSRDISPLLQRPLSTIQLSRLGGFGEENYRGFCVIRPLSTAPVGRTVLQGVDDQDLYTIVITTYRPPRQVGDGPWTPWYADYYHPAV